MFVMLRTRSFQTASSVSNVASIIGWPNQINKTDRLSAIPVVVRHSTNLLGLFFGFLCIKMYVWMKTAEEAVGQKFGKLTVIRVLGIDRYGNKKVNCLCDCGGEKNVSINRLRNGNTSSCGCLKKENAIKQLVGACLSNSKMKGKSEPRLATAKIVFRRYSDGDLSFDDFLRISQQDCYYCGAVPANTTNYYLTKVSKYSKERRLKGYFTYNGLDRVDNSYPHNNDNVVPCCVTCNKAKLQQSKEEFLDWITKVFNKHCQVK